jgi:hypothetical protein
MGINLLKFLFFISFVTCVNLWAHHQVFAQSNTSGVYLYSNLSVSGNSYSNAPTYYRSTIGQASPTSVCKNSNFIVRQGFQQPVFNSKLVQLTEKLSFHLFPNPNRGQFSLQFEATQSEWFELQITDQFGRIVFVDRIFSNPIVDVTLPFASSPGIYIITLRSTTHSTVGHKRFVVTL